MYDHDQDPSFQTVDKQTERQFILEIVVTIVKQMHPITGIYTDSELHKGFPLPSNWLCGSLYDVIYSPC